MWFVCNQATPKNIPVAGTTVRLGNIEAVWEYVVYQGQQCLAAKFDTTDLVLVAQLRGFPGHVVATTAEIAVSRPNSERVSFSLGAGSVAFASVAPLVGEPVARPAEAVTGAGLVAQLVAITIARGWEQSDVAGTGVDDNPGEGGGRSPVSGLTLSELTLTSPPIDWLELRADGRPPWESSSWMAPGPAWVRPGWREPVSTAPPVADPAIGSPILPEGTPVAGDLLDPDRGEEADDAVDELPPVAVEPGTDPAVAAGYPAEAVDAARALAIDWRAKLDADKTPHPSALNYYLAKEGLPKCAPSSKAVAQMAGLLAS